MRKWFIGLVTVIVIILLLPMGFGWHASNVLNQLNGMRVPLKNGEFGTLEVAVTAMQRGWWSSNAVINLNYIEAPLLTMPMGTPANLPAESAGSASSNTPVAKTLLISKIHIVHGPVLWRAQETVPHPFFGQAWFEAPVDYEVENFPERFLEVTGIETGELMGYISLMGEQVYYVSTNEISFQDAAGQLNFSGFDLELDRASNDSGLAFDLVIPHFNFMLYPNDDKQSGTRWLMDGIELKFEGKVDHPAAFWYGTWFGDAWLSVNAVQVEAEGEHYALNRLTTKSSQTEGKDRDLLDGNANLKIENMDVNQQIMGPVEMAISYANLDRVALEDMRKLYETSISSNPDQSFFAALTPAQREQFFDHLFKFVNRLPVYTIDSLTIGTPIGRLNSDFSVKVTAPAKKVADLQTLGYWQQSIDANIDLDLSQALADKLVMWGLQQFYKSMSPLFKLPQPTPPASAQAGPLPEANTNDSIDYQSEAFALLEQAQMFGVIKKVDKDYVLGASYQEGLLTINDKPIIDFSSRDVKPAAK